MLNLALHNDAKKLTSHRNWKWLTLASRKSLHECNELRSSLDKTKSETLTINFEQPPKLMGDWLAMPCLTLLVTTWSYAVNSPEALRNRRLAGRLTFLSSAGRGSWFASSRSTSRAASQAGLCPWSQKRRWWRWTSPCRTLEFLLALPWSVRFGSV